MKASTVAMVVTAGVLAVGLLAFAEDGPERKLTRIEAHEINDPDFRDIISWGRSIKEVQGVPGIPKARIIVHSESRGVVYLSETGEVLRSRRVGRLERIAVSPDGSLLAVMGIAPWDPAAPLATREATWLRVERATGELVWERVDGLGCGETNSARFFVTSQGKVVVSANGIDPDYHEQGGINARPLIFDSVGELVAELPARFYRGELAVSRDGTYCAVSFGDLDAPDPAGCTGDNLELRARQCLALFEVETGRELWRRYFNQCGHGYVAVTAGAERIICGAQEEEWKQPRLRSPGWYSLYVFDKQGNTILRKDTTEACDLAVISPDGTYAAVVVFGSSASRSALLTLDVLNGRVISAWSCTPRCHAHITSVDNAGDLAAGTWVSSESGDTPPEHRWVVVDSAGQTVHQEPCLPGEARGVLLSDGGDLLRRIWKGGIEVYVLEE